MSWRHLEPFAGVLYHLSSPPASFLIGNALDIIFFGAFVAVAIWQRNRRIVHKRLMFMANAMLLAPALARMTFPVMVHTPFLIGAIPLGFIVALFVFDLLTHKRPLAVTVIGCFLFWAFDPLSDALTATPLA